MCSLMAFSAVGLVGVGAAAERAPNYEILLASSLNESMSGRCSPRSFQIALGPAYRNQPDRFHEHQVVSPDLLRRSFLDHIVSATDPIDSISDRVSPGSFQIALGLAYRNQPDLFNSRQVVSLDLLRKASVDLPDPVLSLLWVPRASMRASVRACLFA